MISLHRCNKLILKFCYNKYCMKVKFKPAASQSTAHRLITTARQFQFISKKISVIIAKIHHISS